MILKEYLRSLVEAAMGKPSDIKYIPAVLELARKKQKIGFCNTKDVKSASAGEFLLTKDDIAILDKIYKDDDKDGLNTKLSNGMSFKRIFKSPFSKVESSKSNTQDQTTLKELLCILTIKGDITKESDLDTDEKILKLGSTCLCSNDYADLEKCLKDMDADYCIDHNYISSAIVTNKIFKGEGYKASEYNIERQRSDASEEFYKNAKKFGAGMSDNWNPADIWCIAKAENKSIGFSNDMYKEFVQTLSKTDATNNAKLVAYNSYFLSQLTHGRILPISLKKIDGDSGQCELICAPNLLKALGDGKPKNALNLEKLSPVKIDKIDLMQNAKCKGVASGFRIDFTDSDTPASKFFFQFWEKSNSGFTASLQQTDNSNNKSGIDKSYLCRVLDGYDDISDLYDPKKKTVNYQACKKLITAVKLRHPLIKTTMNYLKDEKNWTVKDTFEPLGIINKALYTIKNLYVVEQALEDAEILCGMYLYGLKVSDDFCPHLKIF